MLFLLFLLTQTGCIAQGTLLPPLTAPPKPLGESYPYQTRNKLTCVFEPQKVDQLIEGETIRVTALNCTPLSTPLSTRLSTPLAPPADPVPSLRFYPVSKNLEIADVEDEGGIGVGYDPNGTSLGEGRSGVEWNESFVVRGVFLGRTVVGFFAENSSIDWREGEGLENGEGVGGRSEDYPVLVTKYRVSVVRSERVIDRMFTWIIVLLVVASNVGMGCKVELSVVREVLRRPIAPIIGFCCQYIIMPLTAFGLVHLLGLHGGQALGLFAVGCAPGGSSSNMYTYLLGGDVSLSVTLTLISLVASLGMIPLYLFTLGQQLLVSDDTAGTRIVIPFRNILYSLVSVVAPLALGLFLQARLPRAARAITRCLRPLYVILLLFIFTVGIYANVYIFRLIRPATIIAGCALPYIGFILAGTAAALLRQPATRVLTIAVETGLQNTGLPIILLKLSLGQPEADIAVVAPIAVAMFAPLPLWVAVAVVEARRRCCRSKEGVVEGGEERGKVGDGGGDEGETGAVPLVGNGNNNGVVARGGVERNGDVKEALTSV